MGKSTKTKPAKRAGVSRTEQLKAAVAEVRRNRRLYGKPFLRRTAKKHGVNHRTVSYYIVGCTTRNIAPPSGVAQRPGPRPQLGYVVEERLAAWVQDMVQHYLTPTRDRLRYKAALLGNQLNKPFRTSDGLPSRTWLMKFMRRTDLVSRAVAPLSNSRYKAMTDVSLLGRWTDSYEAVLNGAAVLDPETGRVLKTYREAPNHVLNGDETGWQRDHKFKRGVVPRGTPVAFRPASEDKESLTQFALGTATGECLPPQYILKGKFNIKDFAAMCRPRTGICMKPNSHFIDGPTFSKLIDAIAGILPDGPPSIHNRYLLLLDGHESRLDVDALKNAKARGIDIMLFPGKCTHFLQPYDQIFGAIKARYSTLYTEAMLLRRFEGDLDRATWLGLVDKAIWNAFEENPSLLKDAFAKTGLVPFNRDLIMQRAEAANQRTSKLKGAVLDEEAAAGVLLELAAGQAVHEAVPQEVERLLEVPKAQGQVQEVMEKAKKLSKKRKRAMSGFFVTSDKFLEGLQQDKAAEEAVEAAKEQRRQAAVNRKAAKAAEAARKAEEKAQRQAAAAAAAAEKQRAKEQKQQQREQAAAAAARGRSKRSSRMPVLQDVTNRA